MASLSKCSACSKPMGSRAIKCPNCGEPRWKPAKVVNEHFSKKDVFLIGFVVFGIGFYLFAEMWSDAYLWLGFFMTLLGPIIILYSFLLDE